MAFNLPLPRVVGDVGPGGGIPTAMNAFNTYDINAAKAKYAALTEQANALSKLAYANLMGPQFMAKLLGNPDILANTPNAQQKINWLLNAGMGQGTGNYLRGNRGALGQSQVNNNPSQQQQSPSPPSTLPPRNNINVPPSPPQQTGNGGPSAPSSSGAQPPPLNDYQQQVSDAAKAWLNSDAGKAQAKQKGYATIPDANTLLNWYHTQPQSSLPINAPAPSATDTGNQQFYENVAKAQDIKAQGAESGTLRAKAINDLDSQYQQDVEGMVPIQRLSQIAESPTFMNMRNQIPNFQNLQLTALSKIGTPEQQRVIGDFIVSSKQAMANAVNSFKGRAMSKEFDFANMMKISDNDTINVILGKLESLTTFKQATMQRDRIASQLMENQHMNRGDAYETANKQVDMDKIRDNVASQLQSPVRLVNKKTKEVKFISPKEYNDLIGQQ